MKLKPSLSQRQKKVLKMIIRVRKKPTTKVKDQSVTINKGTRSLTTSKKVWSKLKKKLVSILAKNPRLHELSQRLNQMNPFKTSRSTPKKNSRKLS